jgi:hypothetical protein
MPYASRVMMEGARVMMEGEGALTMSRVVNIATIVMARISRAIHVLLLSSEK